MKIFLIIIGLLIFGYSLLVLKTGKLNKDPRQTELAKVILRFAQSLELENTDTDWVDVIRHLENSYPNLTAGQKQTKLTHAISMVRPKVPKAQYTKLQSLGARYC